MAEFNDPLFAASTNDKCGDRTFTLLDSSDVALNLSWVTGPTLHAAGSPDVYRIKFKPRNNKGTYTMKVKVTSVTYPSVTLTTSAFTVTIADECALTTLAIPSGSSVASITYEVSASSTAVNMPLFAHE